MLEKPEDFLNVEFIDLNSLNISLIEIIEALPDWRWRFQLSSFLKMSNLTKE